MREFEYKFSLDLDDEQDKEEFKRAALAKKRQGALNRLENLIMVHTEFSLKTFVGDKK